MVTSKPAAPNTINSEQTRFTQYPTEAIAAGATPEPFSGILSRYGFL